MGIFDSIRKRFRPEAANKEAILDENCSTINERPSIRAATAPKAGENGPPPTKSKNMSAVSNSSAELNFSVTSQQNGLDSSHIPCNAPPSGISNPISSRKLTLGARLIQIDAELCRLDPLRLGPMVDDHKMMSLIAEKDKISSEIVGRNLAGRDAEKNGIVEEAIRLYEENVNDEAETPFPYERLAIIYRKQKRYDDEIKVLEAYMRLYGSSDWTHRIEKARDLQKKAMETRAFHDIPKKHPGKSMKEEI